MRPKDIALRKRSQIAMANRTMFLWVVGVSVMFGFTLVGTIFLTKMLLFNERVLAEKGRTVETLKINNNNVPELEKQIRVLDTNQALISSKANINDQAVQVILEALPSDNNPLALGASVQNKLLEGVDGLSLNTLQFDAGAGAGSLAGGFPDTKSEITFSFSVNGDETALKETLLRLEKSIRAIDIISLKIESQGSTRLMTVQARAFYGPARIVKLKDKTVK
jgi:hypothetical protein